tara:strand:- start:70158 stop:70724 length:567 start_codon:yes stop_codon:yes gene_type:complete
MAQDMTGHDGATTETVAHDEAHGSGGFPPFNAETFSSQLIWLVLVFGVLYVVMSRVALPRISNVLETRRARIASDLEDAARAKAQSDEAIASYEQALAEARAKAHALAQGTRDKLTAETDAVRQSTEAKLNQKIAEAEASIAATKATALSNVRAVAIDVTENIVSRLLGEDADKASTERAVDAAMKRS